ncbi:MAG: DUF2178 domain-containing protein [Firmicutes bacterium]|nr:DUF2178 domain-containing protein [Bacillota bacterium]
MEKKTNSHLIGAVVFAVLFLIVGAVELVIKKHVYASMISLGVSLVSLVYCIHLFKYIKDNPNEKYDDERKQFISEKSSSMSFNIFISVIIILKILVKKNIIMMQSDLLLTIILALGLIINSINYLICKSKY